MDNKIRALTLEFLLIFTVFFLSFALVKFVTSPLQQVFLSAAIMPGSLFFIPHGIRVVATWLCGARASGASYFSRTSWHFGALASRS